MKFLVFLLVASSFLSTFGLDLTLKCDKPDSLAPCKEQVLFSATVKENGAAVKDGTAYFFLTLDGNKKLERIGGFDLAKTTQPIEFKRTLIEPGFLRVSMMVVKNKKQYYTASVVGFDPEKIMPGVGEPADFKSFWDGERAAFRQKSSGVKFVELPSLTTNNVKAMRVAVPAPSGRIVHGFLTIPRLKSPMTVPLLVMVPGAGAGFGPDLVQVKENLAILVLNVHTYEHAIDAKERLKQYKNDIADTQYQYRGAEDRQKYFFKEFFLGADWAIDAAARLPEIDGKKIGIYGSSQGGGAALILAGLNTNIKGVVANVPALCDHHAHLQGREPGWPNFFRKVKARDAALKTAQYFDVVNFARYINCPVRVIVGFCDMTCRPGTVYAMYNTLKCDKKIINEPTMQHEIRSSFYHEKSWLFSLLRQN